MGCGNFIWHFVSYKKDTIFYFPNMSAPRKCHCICMNTIHIVPAYLYLFGVVNKLYFYRRNVADLYPEKQTLRTVKTKICRSACALTALLVFSRSATSHPVWSGPHRSEHLEFVVLQQCLKCYFQANHLAMKIMSSVTGLYRNIPSQVTW